MAQSFLLISYFVYVYLQDKNVIDTKLSVTSQQISDEQSNRLSNIKYVVDQVNTVNSDIATQFSASNTSIFKSLSSENIAITSNLNLQNSQYSGLNTRFSGLQSQVGSNTANITQMNAGFGNYITFGNPNGINGYNLLNLPSSPVTNMNLMSQVNLLMGMTAKNLNPVGGSNVNFCYGPDNKNCSSFPNADGDTVISAAPISSAGFTKDRVNNVVLNAPTKINGPLQLCNRDGNVCFGMETDNNGILIIENKQGITKGKLEIDMNELQMITDVANATAAEAAAQQSGSNIPV